MEVMTKFFKRFLFTIALIAFTGLAFGQNRLSVKDDLEQSSTVGSIIATDGSNEQFYLVPGAETAILSIQSGVPTWIVGGSGEQTTVTDLVNGLTINLTGFDITVAPNIPELSNVGSLDPLNDVFIIFDSSSGAHRKASISQIAASQILSDISDVPVYPTATTDDYLLNFDDATNTFTWEVVPAGTGGGGGATFKWNFSTTITDADPGNGNFRFNNALGNLTTQIFIDELTSNGLNIDNLVLN